MSQYIDSNEKLIEIAKLLKSKAWIALDTEFIREKNYYPKLCLVQVAAGDDVLACIDPLAISDLSPLIEILKDPSITKVFHAAYQDLEIFYYIMNCVPSPIFDTQPAASVLGIGEQVGYARLVEELLGVSLEKSQSRTDWSHRPLSEKQINYAIDDVRYLQQIYPLIYQKLENKSRLHWLVSDFKHLTDSSTYALNLETCWNRVKGRQRLKSQQLAVLRELAAWREEVAIQRDKPRRWIVNDDVLVDLARQQPDNTEQIKKIRGANDKHLKRYHQVWFNAIKTGKTSPQSSWPSLPMKQKPNAEQDVLVDLLMTAVKYQAKKNHVSATVITTRKQVINMLLEGRTSLSNDWRGALVNSIFEEILSGKKYFSVKNGKVLLS